MPEKQGICLPWPYTTHTCIMYMHTLSFCTSLLTTNELQRMHMKINVHSTPAKLVIEEEKKGNPDPIHHTRTVQTVHVLSSHYVSLANFHCSFLTHMLYMCIQCTHCTCTLYIVHVCLCCYRDWRDCKLRGWWLSGERG